jgi:hypothetical protein
MEKFLVAIATSLTSTLMVAASRLIRDEAIGDDQERGLADIFKAATSVVLVEAVRQDRNDRDLPDRLETEFGRFYGDRWVAETLVRVALSAEPPPFDKLCRRYNELGNDSTDLPIDFEDAMRLLVKELADRPPCLAHGSALLPRSFRPWYGADGGLLRRVCCDPQARVGQIPGQPAALILQG